MTRWPVDDQITLRAPGSVPGTVAVAHLTGLDEALGAGRGLLSVAQRATTGHIERLVVELGDDGPRPHRVTCHVTWPGSIGMALDGEITVQAACGLMHVHGRRFGAPVPLGIDYASTATGVIAAQGLLAALVGRLRGIRTTEVETSVAHTALLTVSQHLAVATCDPDGQRAWRPGGPPFRSADGVLFEMEVLDPADWRSFWARLGAPAEAVRRGWPAFSARFATASCPLPDDLHRTVGDHPFAVCRTAARAARVSILRLRDPGDGPPCPDDNLRPWTLDPLPGPGGHPRGAPRAAPGDRPLEGLLVVEAGRRVQGPLAAHVLGLLGARIVRVEPPGGDLQRGEEPLAGECSARFLALNQGKEVVELDLRVESGRAALRQLLEDADVFLHNWAPGKASQRGLDAEALAVVRSGLVVVHASGWSGRLGPEPPLGTDYMAQAHSGLAALIRPDDEPPAPSLMTITDTLGGLVAAEGALAGLLARLLTGQGQRVESSLLSAAIVAVRAARTPSLGDAARPRWGPLHRPLPTSDGYLVLSEAARDQPGRVAAALGVEVGATSDRAAVVRHTRRSGSTVLRERLATAGLGSVEACTDLAALAADDRFAGVLEQGACSFVRAPWRFHP